MGISKESGRLAKLNSHGSRTSNRRGLGVFWSCSASASTLISGASIGTGYRVPGEGCGSIKKAEYLGLG
jgi:hypothetical protein